MAFVVEGDGGFFKDAAALDVDVFVGVDEDVGDGLVFEQRFERAEAKDLVDDFLGELVALGAAEGNALFAEELLDDA